MAETGTLIGDLEDLADNFMYFAHDLSIFSCLWLFCRYMCLPKKNLGNTSVLILSISDFIFHVSFIPTIFHIPDQNHLDDARLITYVNASAFCFSFFWTCCIALLAYRKVSVKEEVNAKPYFIVGFIFSLIFASILPPVVAPLTDILRSHTYAWWYGWTFWVLENILAICLIPVISLTTFFYLRSIHILKENSATKVQASRDAIKVLYQYPLVQIVVTGSALICWFIAMQSMSHLSDMFIFLSAGFSGLTGFGNSMVYFFNRMSSHNLPSYEGNQEDLNASQQDLEVPLD